MSEYISEAKLIDSHCHLHDEEFFSEEEALNALEKARKNGVGKIVCIGTSHEDSLKARDFAEKHENVYWTYGIHPSETGQGLVEPIFSTSGLEFSSTSYAGAPGEPSLRDEPLGRVDQRSDLRCRNIRVENSNQNFTMPSKTGSTTRPVAIGEVGLDYHYDGYDRHEQIELFEKMLQLATEMDLPVSFHVREAFDDFFGVVGNFPKIRGVVHSFSDSKKNLRRILNETDFYVGVNGMATYSTLPTPPVERILLETDAPFLAPAPHRGEKNEPAYIPDVAQWLAEKLNMEFNEVAKITTKNTENLFNLQ